MAKAKKENVDTQDADALAHDLADATEANSTGVDEADAKAQEETESASEKKKAKKGEITFVCSHFPDLIIGCATQTVQFTGGELVTSDEEVIKSVKSSQPYEMGQITEK